MPFFGILWVASWLNCSLSYGFPGSRISDYLASAFKNNPLTNVSNSLGKSTKQSLAFKNKTLVNISNPLVKLTSQASILSTEIFASQVTFKEATGVEPIFVPTNIATASIPTTKPLIITAISSSLTTSPDPSVKASGFFMPDTGDKPSSAPKFASWWLESGEENFCLAETTSLAYSSPNLPNIDGGKAAGMDIPSQVDSKISLPTKVMQVLNSLFRWQDYFVSKPKPTPATVVVARSDTLMPPPAKRNFWILSQRSPENLLSDVQQSPEVPLVSATPKFQVWLKRHLIAEFEQKSDANLLAQRLQQLVSTTNLDAQQLQPGLVNGEPAVKLGDRLLFMIDDALKASIRTNKDLIAVKLTNSIRLALGVTALDLAQAQTKMYRLSETNNRINGLASWYGSYFHGRQTANGETYDQYALTVAHPSLPFDTYLKVTNQKNNKSVIVRVNDRGPYIGSRVLDLSTIAARCIDSEDTGVVMVDAVIMEPSRK